LQLAGLRYIVSAMHWLQTLDAGLFRFINLTLSNPVFDAVMPFASGNIFFFPALAVVAAFLVWKGGPRGSLCVVLLVLIVWLGDSLVCNTIKHAIGRPRPFWTVSEAHTLVGRSQSFSLPSSHAANWFAATMVVYVYYRRSVWFMLPAAGLVGFSRVYNGVHYPSDVLAGAILGAGYAAAALWSLDALWQRAGRAWFPLWWEKIPSLLEPSLQASPVQTSEPGARSQESRATAHEAHIRPHELDAHWLRVGYLLIAVVLLGRLAYLASGFIELTGDEAYQWLWSKHLALSYYSKPPLIAYTQFLGTKLWGDTAFGVRFFSPVIAAILSFVLLRFFAREVNARAGFCLLLINTATPLAAVGGVLMTVDPLLTLFWTAAMIAGWRAVQQNQSRHWLWVGLWMGLGFLSKYTELFQWLCWAVFFALWPPARKHLATPGPYLALLINLVSALPVLVWNYQHQWITVSHVAGDAALGAPWKPTLKHLGDVAGFMGSQAAILNPIFFVGMIWAAIAFWRRSRHEPLLVYFFSMGAPPFLIYLLYTFHSRVLPNWTAPAVAPLFCLMVAYWDARWRQGARQIKPWLVTGLVLGLTVVILGHDTDLIGRLTGHGLPVNRDPLHRARGWKEVARLAREAQQELQAEGQPVFIIASHYRFAGEISFYLPQAKAAEPANPLVYCQSTSAPVDQFYFWPGYTRRKGQNAIFIRELDRDHPQPGPPPKQLEQEFGSVTDIGIRAVSYHGQPWWVLQFFACRGLR